MGGRACRAPCLLPAYKNKGTLYLSRYDVSFSGPLPPDFFGDDAGGLAWEQFQPFQQPTSAGRQLITFSASDASRTKALTDPPGVQQVERWRIVTLPLWAPLFCFSLLPGMMLVRRHTRQRRAKRVAGGLCPNCGYDLRATPQGCPECGPVPAPAA